MEFRILGPIEVSSGGRQVRLGGAKQRALLAVLLLHRNEVVSVDRLIDELWEGRPPATAVKTVQVRSPSFERRSASTQTPTMRRRFVTRSPGSPSESGRTSWTRPIRAARGRRPTGLRAGAPEQATESLLEALSLWRGPALADFALDAFAQTEIARLEEARVSAIEERIDADLAAGRYQGLIGELETLIRAHPSASGFGATHARPVPLGPQAEALAAYQDARPCSDEELGSSRAVPPRLERAILVIRPRRPVPTPAEVEPTLDVPVPTPAEVEPTLAVPRPSRRRFILVPRSSPSRWQRPCRCSHSGATVRARRPRPATPWPSSTRVQQVRR